MVVAVILGNGRFIPEVGTDAGNHFPPVEISPHFPPNVRTTTPPPPLFEGTLRGRGGGAAEREGGLSRDPRVYQNGSSKETLDKR